MRELLDYLPKLLVPYCFVNLVFLVGFLTGWLPDVFLVLAILMFLGAGALYAFAEVAKVALRRQAREAKRLERERQGQLPPPDRRAFMQDWTEALREKEQRRR